MILTLIVASSSMALGASVCTPIGEGQLRCTINNISDCQAIEDYPYARTLFCPAAFSAARTMAAKLEKTLGVRAATGGFFHYYQTLADPEAPPEDQAQTTIACLDTPAPYPSGSRVVVGAGLPLCHLAAFVTSAGPISQRIAGGTRNPVPGTLREYPSYFSKLFSRESSFPLTRFRTGSQFDRIVERLGAATHDRFIVDYPRFSPTKFYDHGRWQRDAQFHGISGGGGWGGEIAILAEDGTPLTLLAFGGGGGGGLTSERKPPAGTPSTVLGAGGGGGMQFGNAYRFGDRHYNGLGLGAGMGSDETQVQYS